MTADNLKLRIVRGHRRGNLKRRLAIRVTRCKNECSTDGNGISESASCFPIQVHAHRISRSVEQINAAAKRRRRVVDESDLSGPSSRNRELRNDESIHSTDRSSLWGVGRRSGSQRLRRNAGHWSRYRHRQRAEYESRESESDDGERCRTMEPQATAESRPYRVRAEQLIYEFCNLVRAGMEKRRANR